MKKNFKVALVQHKYKGTDWAINAADGLSTVEKAKRMGADIVLFPECFLTGYELPINNKAALEDSNPFLQRFCIEAKKLKIGIVLTALTKGTRKPQNSAYLIDQTGRILMKYSKVHTCDFADEACLASGDEFFVRDFAGVKIGLMICYDREYPESARVLMMKGAEIILVPNDCEAMKPRVQALSVRAYENMVGVAMANPPGPNAGCSCAFSPICWDKRGHCVDNTIFIGDALTDDIFIADFDLERLREYRRSEMMGNTFRKVQAYSELLNPSVEAPFIRKQGPQA
ncbi:MAG: carbon-nitrogen hydrolase family protein [Sporolactobacillus sp.]|jgi:predicted amidohydrolase|nr:carbon-nitrogen hydrolase family protein [Sporolactobacillus sp.]